MTPEEINELQQRLARALAAVEAHLSELDRIRKKNEDGNAFQWLPGGYFGKGRLAENLYSALGPAVNAIANPYFKAEAVKICNAFRRTLNGKRMGDGQCLPGPESEEPLELARLLAERLPFLAEKVENPATAELREALVTDAGLLETGLEGYMYAVDGMEQGAFRARVADLVGSFMQAREEVPDWAAKLKGTRRTMKDAEANLRNLTAAVRADNGAAQFFTARTAESARNLAGLLSLPVEE